MLRVNTAIGFGSGKSRYISSPFVFNGSARVQDQTSWTSGISDSKKFTLSCWIRFNNIDSGTNTGILTFTSDVDSQPKFIFQVLTTSKVAIWAYNSSNSIILDISTSPLSTSNWYHILASYDGTTAQLYVNDSSDLTTTTATNSTIDFYQSDKTVTLGKNGLASVSDPSLEADMADVWMEIGTRLDFSVEANRRLFITSNLDPVNLGSTGQNPIGQTPTIYTIGPITGSDIQNYGDVGFWQISTSNFSAGSTPVKGNT